MQQLPEQSVSTWSIQANRSHPSTIDWDCPHCAKAISLTPRAWTQLDGDYFWSQGKCPRCRGRILFFTLNVGTGHGSLAGGSLFMFPRGRMRVPASEVLDSAQLRDPVKNAYRSAVSIVNAGEWNGGAVLCRRLLEGIVKTVLPVEQHGLPLAKQLESLPQHRDLARPIVELADAVRKGGNLGAHFDLEREPDQHVTSLMLELCEDLLQYLFVLPDRIADLHRKIEALGQTSQEVDKE